MKSVYVGMSGGVDSSVAALLLKQQGYDVTGVYMKNWTQDFPGTPCTWKQDYQDAKRVAVKLGIELKVYDFEKEYRHKVVDFMVSEYQKGRTPNPDIMCNQEVKFKLFLDTALEDGAEFIATGHYSRTKNGRLLTATNIEKDQTYFLYRVSEMALKRTLFPIGEFKAKSEVRQLAKHHGLVTAAKKDSQGICFVGQVGIREFLLSELGPQPAGPIIDQNSREIGQHDGAIFYTIGQRHGLNVGGGLPYYVTGKDMKNNTVFVTSDLQDEKLWHKDISLDNIHWINGVPDFTKSYHIRTRYRAALTSCTLYMGLSTLDVALSEPVRALTPGQSAVIYDGEQVLGGGIVTLKPQTGPNRHKDAGVKSKVLAK